MSDNREGEVKAGILPGNLDVFVPPDDHPPAQSSGRTFTRKRWLSIGTGGALLALSVAAGSTAAMLAWNRFVLESQRQALPDNMTGYVKEQDAVLEGKPERFPEIAPIVAGLAIRQMAKELSGIETWNVSKLRAKLYFNWFDNHKQAFSKVTPCKGIIPNEENYAASPFLDDRSYFNLTRILYRDIERKVVRPQVASLLAAITIAQTLETSAKVVAIKQRSEGIDPRDGSKITISHYKGLMTYAEYPAYDVNQKVCRIPVGLRPNGVVIRDAAKRIMSVVGINGVIPDGLDGDVSAYGKMTDDLFKGNYRRLLAFQHVSNQDGFYGLIGQAVGANGNTATKKGQEYFLKILEDGSN